MNKQQEEIRLDFLALCQAGLESGSLKTKSFCFALFYGVVVSATIISALGLFQYPASFVFGLPASIAYLSVCALSFMSLAVGGYFWLFRRWSRNIDSKEGSS